MRFLVPIVVISAIAGCDSSDSGSAPDPILAALLTSPGLTPYRLEESNVGRFSTKHVFAAEGERSLHLEVFENMDAETADQLREDGIMGIEALYADALSPYPGDISRTIVKDRKFKPKLVRSDHGTYYLLYANERLGYGTSTGAAVRHVSLMGWLHSRKADRFMKIRLFSPAESTSFETLEALFRSFEIATP